MTKFPPGTRVRHKVTDEVGTAVAGSAGTTTAVVYDSEHYVVWHTTTDKLEQEVEHDNA